MVYVRQRCVVNLIVVGETEKPMGQEVKEHVMFQLDRVGVGMGLYTATLKGTRDRSNVT